MEELTKYLSSLVAPVWVIVILFAIYVAEQAIKVVVAWKTYKRQVVFNKLHQERAEATKDLFQKIMLVNEALTIYMHPGLGIFKMERYSQDVNDKDNVARLEIALNDVVRFYNSNRIFFSKELCDKIEYALEEFVSIGQDYYSISCEIKLHGFDAWIKKRMEKRKSIRDDCESKLPELLSNIEVEFRKLLGAK